MTVHSLIKIYQYFGKSHFLHLLSTQRNEAAGFHNTMADVHQATRHHTSLVTAARTSILYTDTKLGPLVYAKET
jgi:hypothetical protein